jgi:hypothetical protein
MNSPVSFLIKTLADDLNLEVHGSPFHGAGGLELRKQAGDPDTLICIGYIFGPEETGIYRGIIRGLRGQSVNLGKFNHCAGQAEAWAKLSISAILTRREEGRSGSLAGFMPRKGRGPCHWSAEEGDGCTSRRSASIPAFSAAR